VQCWKCQETTLNILLSYDTIFVSMKQGDRKQIKDSGMAGDGTIERAFENI